MVTRRSRGVVGHALADSLLLLEHFILFAVGAAIVWAWPDAPILVLAAGYVMGIAGVLRIAALEAVGLIKAVRWVRTEWNRTFRLR